ncbi:hypothetical protein NEOLI_001229 [Neolecta irregularis DAH-3]|uniref:CENP-T/Histone H4 histone fold domain-containing protein n=1 Tax=Neolecta irregularis (strain DAH-3) TaxID=1198029 RepID=A0A1U7LKL3_NEOID|nr:hypothetical protein NEOLI_001229 [Neolecta irregularis DAH-3]|eukprot:OLL23082.1 hypothetical protein NEOLI_001229 [Neolecta irregularis DAH-3]
MGSRRHTSCSPLVRSPRILALVALCVLLVFASVSRSTKNTPTKKPPPFFHLPHPNPHLRNEDLVDSFAGYKYREQCRINALDLHVPFDPLCPDLPSLLDALSNGGRVGFDAPYISRSCDFRWYSTHEVCGILKRYERVLFFGDSLIRQASPVLFLFSDPQLYSALIVFMRRDLGYGAVENWDFGELENKQCFCENQISVKDCNVNTVSIQTLLIREPTWIEETCKDVDLKLHILVKHPIPDFELDRVAEDIAAHSKLDKPWAFIFGHGLWNHLESNATLNWLDSIEAKIKSKLQIYPDSASPRIFVAPAAAGPHKPDEWIPLQGNKKIMLFEEEMKILMKARGMEVLGTWNATIQAFSYDGSHRGLRTQLLLSQMVLNILDMDWYETKTELIDWLLIENDRPGWLDNIIFVFMTRIHSRDPYIPPTLPDLSYQKCPVETLHAKARTNRYIQLNPIFAKREPRAFSGALMGQTHTPRQPTNSRPLSSSRRTPSRIVLKKKEPTPHKARALQQKSAKETFRRKSLQNARETPRDILRTLSRAITKAPASVTKIPLIDQDRSSDNDDIAPPILQSDIDHSDSSSEEDKPPRLMSEQFSLPDEDVTVELPRREALQHRLSLGRPSLDGDSTIHMSDIDDDTIPFGQAHLTQEMIFEDFQNDTSLYSNTAADDLTCRGIQDYQNDETVMAMERRRTLVEDENPFLFNMPDPQSIDEPPLPIQPPDEKRFEIWSDAGEETVAQHNTNPPGKPNLKRKGRPIKLSQAGVQLPSLPCTLLKTMASNFSGCTLSKTTLEAICSASDKFLEQMSFDISAYAKHAGRKTIEEIDVIQLMKRCQPSTNCFSKAYVYFNYRQRILNKSTSIYALACKYLPRELRDEIQIEASIHPQKRKKLKTHHTEKENEEREE